MYEILVFELFQPVEHLRMTLLWTEETAANPSALLAWCSYEESTISIIELETKQSYANFKDSQPTEGMIVLRVKRKNLFS